MIICTNARTSSPYSVCDTVGFQTETKLRIDSRSASLSLSTLLHCHSCIVTPALSLLDRGLACWVLLAFEIRHESHRVSYPVTGFGISL